MQRPKNYNLNKKYLMHIHSGDIATLCEWREEFKSMDLESWFGMEYEECKGLHWLDAVDSSSGEYILQEVVQDEDGEWVNA